MVVETVNIRQPASRISSSTGQAVRIALYIVVVLTALRFVSAAYLPLSFDEAYFWLWSKHLALSYYDHPPLIALAIRLGTMVFGDTELGVRLVPLLASVLASWAVWRSTALLLADEAAGALACCIFNATLMVASQMIGAIPDSLVMAAAALLLLAIAKLQTINDGRWWMLAGFAIGIALLAKYTAFFLGAGLTLWFIATPQGRVWLRSVWPYAAAALACACFAPALIWNAEHDWISFKFQFGRVVTGGLTLRYLVEFIAGQLILASPFILIFGLLGLGKETRTWRSGSPLAIAAVMIWPALVYFVFHAIHDRVQGNWPSFVYPALAVLAASMIMVQVARPRVNAFLRWSRLLALPLALAILAASYLQAFTGIISLGASDPIARMTAVGFAPVAEEISTLASKQDAAAIVTTNYITTAWLSFYLHPHVPIIQIAAEYRLLCAPQANLALLKKPLLFVTRRPEHELRDVTQHFANVDLVKVLTRSRADTPIDKFYVYSISGFHGAPLGRVP